MSTPTLYRDHLIVENDPRVTALMPHAKTFVQDGKEYALIPHQLDEYKVLRNLGYDIAPPILTSYSWPIVDGYAPFDAQRFTAAMITTNERSFVLNDLGTGKTRAVLFAYDYLKAKGVVDKMIVVAPLSTLRRTWEREVMQTFPGRRVSIVYGSAQKRQQRLADMDADIYVVNHHGLKIISDQLAMRPDINMIALDELTTWKNKQSEMWKVANKVINTSTQFKRITALTGLVTPQGPDDAYGQIKLVTPGKLNGWSFTRFREHTMTKITSFKWVPRIDGNERVFNLMQPSVRFTRDQCMDLPPCQNVDYEAELSKDQRELFNSLKKDAAALLAAGELTTANAADLQNKMVQVVLGCVYKKDGSVHYVDTAPRLKILDEVIDASRGKVIVYTPYKHNLAMLEEHLTRRKIACASVSGDTPPSERDKIFGRFQSASEPRVLLAHPKCMAHGLTLTEANTICWYGPPPSVELYEQANARVTRPGQKLQQYIAHIIATSLESQIYRRLQKRLETSGLLNDMVKNQQLSEVL